MGTDGKAEKELLKGRGGVGLSESHNTAKQIISYVSVFIYHVSLYTMKLERKVLR